MKTRFVKTTTKDGLALQGLLCEPNERTEKIVIFIHGMAGNFYTDNFVFEEAKKLNDNSLAFLTVNNRGHDSIAEILLDKDIEEIKQIGNFNEKFSDCLFDISSWVEFAAQEGFTDIVLQGHSLGASKVIYYIAKTNDQSVKKVILASPADMIALTEKWPDHQETLKTAKQMINDGQGDRLVPKKLDNWYFLTANTYVDFGERDNPIDIFTTYDREKESILSEINIPMLAFFGSNDEAATMLDPNPQNILDIIKYKAKACPRFDTSIIRGASHIYFRYENEVAQLVVDWLSSS